MVTTYESSSSSSSSWTGGFLIGSVVTAAAIFLYSNHKALISLLEEVREEYKGEEDGPPIHVVVGKKGIQALRHLKSSKAMALNEEEQIGFLADIVKQLWPYINRVGSDTIRATAESIFQGLPGLLRSLQFTKIDLGNVPIRLDNVVVHDVDLDSNTLTFDVDVVWDGNCDIQLKADLIGVFGVKSIKLKGRLSVLLRPLVPKTAMVGAIQYGFINTPELSLQYSGMAHVADVQGIDQSVTDAIKCSVKRIMVLPRRKMYKIDKLADFRNVYKSPLGILRVTVLNGRGFVVEKRLLGDDIPDCYCIVELGDLKYQTNTVPDNLAPVWNESMDFVLSDLDQCLTLQCWDQDSAPLDADDHLGTAYISPGEIILSGGTMELPLQYEHRPNGAFVTLRCDVLNLTTPTHLESLELFASCNNHLCGLLTIFVLRALDIPLAKEDAATCVQVTCESHKFTTSVVVDSTSVDCLNPWYDKAFLVPLTRAMVENGKIPSIRLDLINGTSTELGSLVIAHDEIVSAFGHTLYDTRSIGNKGCKLQFQISLQSIESPKPLQIEFFEVQPVPIGDGETPTAVRELNPSPILKVVNSPGNSASERADSTGDYVLVSERGAEDTKGFHEIPPASTDQTYVRVTAVGGKGFKDRKTAFFLPDDIPDIYLNITFGSSPQVWRTETCHNKCAPTWNESQDFILQSHGQIISIDVFDEDQGGPNEKSSTRDICIGSFRVTVGKVLLAGGVMENEILWEGKGTGAFVTIKCDLVKR